jgi:hypothetical protein
MSLVAVCRPPRSVDRPREPTRFLVGDELVAVLLHRDAGELPSTDDDDLAAVLLELLDQRDEVAVAADDDEGVDVVVREAISSASSAMVMSAPFLSPPASCCAAPSGWRAASAAGCSRRPLPVAVGDLGDDLATFLDGLEHEADVELRPMVDLTPISTLSKSMKTAMRVVRGSVRVMYCRGELMAPDPRSSKKSQ